MKHPPTILISLLLVIAAAPCSAEGKKFKIAASIRPLYGIAAAVGGDEAEVSLILDTPVSPHDAPSRPSQIQKILQADAVLLVDRNFETFLQKPLEVYGGRRKIIELSKSEGIDILPMELIQVNIYTDWRTNPKSLKELTGEDNPKDYHLWLDPEYGINIARNIHRTMVEKMPERKQALDANLAAFEGQVRHVQKEVVIGMPGGDVGFISEHNGYQYFTRAFSVKQYGSINQDTTSQTDPAKIAYISNQAADPSTRCIVQDIETTSRDAEQLAKKSKKALVTLDPLGQQLPLDRNLYPNLIYRMGAAFADCLRN